MEKHKKAIIKILDEVNAVVLGLHYDHIDWFHNYFARKVPNYYFHPKFRLGQWSGDIYYFHKTGKTYTYLLNEIVPKLQSFGYRLELIDNREPGVEVDFVDENIFAHIKNSDGKPFILRYYQVEAINAVIENGGGVILAGTGSGKTLKNAALCKQYGDQDLKTITIVPSVDLITQTKETFSSLGLDVGEYSGDVKDVDHEHVVSTWQSLQNNQRIMQLFDMVVVDECFDENTLIVLADKTTKKIKEVQPGDKILSYNFETKRFEPDVVVKLFKNLIASSKEDMYELEFDNGTILKVTGNHKILTTTGYKRADELSEEDEIVNFVDGET